MKTALTATGAYRRRVVVRWCVLPIVLLACAGTASGLEPITLRSRSGQFIVYGLPPVSASRMRSWLSWRHPTHGGIH
jgi:hypothetical protein